MTPHFADSFYYLAVLSEDDDAHDRAVALTREARAPMVTTDWVLTEVGDAMAGATHRPRFLALLAALQSDPTVRVIPASRELFERGVDLFSRRADKEWSLTDCISFVVMQEQGITEALTGDRISSRRGSRPGSGEWARATVTQ